MKLITPVASCRHVTMLCALLGTLFLPGCSGGSAGTSAAVTPPPVLASFSDIVPAPGFTWATAKQVAPAITLSPVASPAIDIPGLAAIDLSDLSVLISNYTCQDPTGGSGPLSTPLRTSLLVSLPYATLNVANLKNIQIPAATGDLLVEIVDGNSVLHSELLTPDRLSSLKIDTLDKTKTTLASCPG